MIATAPTGLNGGDGAVALHSTPCAERRIACVAGVRIIPNSMAQREIWVRSPRTGNEVVISDGWWPQLEERAARLVARIIHNRATGLSVISFTPAELAALVAVRNLMAEKNKPLPSNPDTPSLFRRYKPNRRRSYRRH